MRHIQIQGEKRSDGKQTGMKQLCLGLINFAGYSFQISCFNQKEAAYLDLSLLMTYSCQSNTFVAVGCKTLTIISLKKVEDEGKEPSISIRWHKGNLIMTGIIKSLNLRSSLLQEIVCLFLKIKKGSGALCVFSKLTTLL